VRVRVRVKVRVRVRVGVRVRVSSLELLGPPAETEWRVGQRRQLRHNAQ